MQSVRLAGRACMQWSMRDTRISDVAVETRSRGCCHITGATSCHECFVYTCYLCRLPYTATSSHPGRRRLCSPMHCHARLQLAGHARQAVTACAPLCLRGLGGGGGQGGHRWPPLAVRAQSSLGALPCAALYGRSRCCACRFDVFFVEPLSHTILNGIARGFLTFICDTGNGLLVEGMPFCLSAALQARMDRVITHIQKHTSFTRPFRLLAACVTLDLVCYIDDAPCSIASAPRDAGNPSYLDGCSRR